MPGDLGMAFVSDIKHPTVDAGVIHRNYILVGIIKSFVSVEWDTGMADEEWNGITVQERLKASWGKSLAGKRTPLISHPLHTIVK